MPGAQGLVLFMTVFVDLIAAVGAGVALMSLLYVRDTAEVGHYHSLSYQDSIT